MTKTQLLKTNAYIRIRMAARKGRGVRLSPDEVIDMSMDTAIATTAIVDAERAGWRFGEDGELYALDRVVTK